MAYDDISFLCSIELSCLGSWLGVLESLSPACPDLKDLFIFRMTELSKILSKHSPQPDLTSLVLMKKPGT